VFFYPFLLSLVLFVFVFQGDFELLLLIFSCSPTSRDSCPCLYNVRKCIPLPPFRKFGVFLFPFQFLEFRYSKTHISVTLDSLIAYIFSLQEGVEQDRGLRAGNQGFKANQDLLMTRRIRFDGR
jgi:hypothetical protein